MVCGMVQLLLGNLKFLYFYILNSFYNMVFNPLVFFTHFKNFLGHFLSANDVSNYILSQGLIYLYG